MMLSIDHLRLLDNVSIPQGLFVQVTNDSNEFINLKAELNNATPQLFGTCYRQGNRLHFATGMSIRDYIKLVRLDQAPRGSTLDEVREHSNRPKEAAHGKNIAKYLDETACVGLPFIFPSFILNYGLGWTEDMPKAKLIIFAGTMESLVWPAIFRPPATGGLPVTDGGHRTDETDRMLRTNPGRLPENAISVIFVFEEDLDQYHQDFADAAKAKAMAKSLTASWDRRDVGRLFGISLVEANPHLRKVIDATSNSVNLSNNSMRAWSMSALHSAVAGIYESEVKLSENPLTYDPARVSTFFDELFISVPMLNAVANGVSPASFRNMSDRGGCVLLRGVGLAVLMQGYQYAIETGMPLDKMAKKLAELDWYVLKEGAPVQGDNEDAYTYVNHAAFPIWKNMLAMMAGDRNFRLKGTRDAAATSFAAIRAQLGI